MKKKHILLPLVLLVYLAFMAYTYYPEKNPELSYTQYYTIIGVTIVIIIVLSFFLKKKEEHRKKYLDKPKKENP